MSFLHGSMTKAYYHSLLGGESLFCVAGLAEISRASTG